MVEEKRHILICGERGVGKSTLIEKLLQACPRPRYGFLTRMEPADEAGFHPIYIHPAAQPREAWTYTDENRIGSCDSRTHLARPEVFDALGVRLIREARPEGILVMDELGFFEAQAAAFTAAVLQALARDIPVIAAVKSRTDVPFLNAVRSMPKAEIFYITRENRDQLLQELLPRMKNL